MKQHKFDRIDKGIKRDREILPPAPKLSIPGALTGLDDEGILDQIAGGAYVSHLAKKLNVSDVALHLRLRKHPGYKEAMKLRNAVKLDEHQSGIEGARTNLSLARAREAWKAASWRAERECPEEWGQHIHSTVEITGDLGDRLRRAQERVIEGEKPLLISESPGAGSCVIDQESSATD